MSTAKFRWHSRQQHAGPVHVFLPPPGPVIHPRGILHDDVFNPTRKPVCLLVAQHRSAEGQAYVQSLCAMMTIYMCMCIGMSGMSKEHRHSSVQGRSFPRKCSWVNKYAVASCHTCTAPVGQLMTGKLWARNLLRQALSKAYPP